ncbi:MAG: hypothetical protein MJ071_07880 [Oscillospiraceae bacterium]|nr:hypothetical protein [Oscillospiraceae bacterium]
MAFKLESNPLENNALFAPVAEEPAPAPAPEKKPAAKKTAPKAVKEEKPAETEEFIRATFIVRKDLLQDLKDYAYTERLEIKELINKILDTSLTKMKKDLEKQGVRLLHKE